MATPAAVNLDDDLATRLERLASARHRSADGMMREAIAQYVTREEKRDSMWNEALQAWDAYRMDGLHVTATEADAWLARLEAGEEAIIPDLHT